MRRSELEAFARTTYLTDGQAPVLDRARPLFGALIDALLALPEEAKIGERIAPFRNCVEGLNDMAEDIETVERECFCDAIYRIGTIVGLEARSQFVERWRGDW